MVVYSCAREWEAMLTCIYVAWSSKIGHQNIRLELEPIEQYTLFDEYHHVDADADKADKLIDAINQKISPYFYSELVYSSMAYEKDILDNIFHMMILGFNYGTQVLDMVHFRDVMRHKEIRKRLGSEVCRFKEILRFHEIGGNVYVAHIEPKSKLVVALGPAIADRMPSEHWMIIDDIHKEAVIHPKDEPFYLKQLSDLEFERLLETENENDNYTDLWKIFFETIAIKERTNKRCQNNHSPLWARKHAVEFMQTK